MRIVDALRTRNQLTAVHDTASEGQRQARRERQAAEHSRAVIAMLDEIPRNDLDFDALGGRVIEHTASADGDYYRTWGGDVSFRGNDVTKFYVAQDGTPTMLERCTKPSSRTELEQMQTRKEQRRLERDAIAKQRRAQMREAAR